MRRLELDFAARRPAQGWAWLLAGLAAAGIAWWQYQDALHARDDAQAVYELRLQDSSRKPARANNSRQDAEHGRMRARLGARWATLLDALESSVQKNTALLDVNPDAAKGTVKLLLEAKNEDAMFAYIRALSAQPGVTQVLLLSHELQTGDPQQPIRFNLSARWSP